MPEWSDPVKGTGSTHDFNVDPELIANYEKTDTVDVEDKFSDVPGAMRSQTIHRLIRDGSMVDVWGSADLDGKLRGIGPGTLVRIVYLGFEDLDGGRRIKRFLVQYDLSSPKVSAQSDDIPF